jgi:hypothetical protein
MSDETVDLYERRVQRIANSDEAKLLSQLVCVAVDDFARYFERCGLAVNISFERTTAPAGDPDNVVVFTKWSALRHGGGSGNAA